MSDDRARLRARFATAGPRPLAPAPGAPSVPAVPIRDTVSGPSAAPPIPDRIQLKVRRAQTRSMTGAVTFSIHVIAELAPEARRAIEHYRLGKTVLYQKDLQLKLSLNMVLALWRFLVLWLTRKRWQIRIDDLVRGRTLTAHNVIELMRIEDEIRQAAQTFAQILRLAATFGGEEVITL